MLKTLGVMGLILSLSQLSLAMECYSSVSQVSTSGGQSEIQRNVLTVCFEITPHSSTLNVRDDKTKTVVFQVMGSNGESFNSNIRGAFFPTGGGMVTAGLFDKPNTDGDIGMVTFMEMQKSQQMVYFLRASVPLKQRFPKDNP